MKIAYCMPVRNEQNNVIQSIRSLLNQTIPGVVYVAVDGDITDNTRIILENSFNEEKEKGLLKVWYNEERKGHAVLRNFLPAQTTEEIIAICDADLYYKDRGEAITEFFEENKDKHVFSSSLHCRSNDNPYEIWQQDGYQWDFKSKCPISFPTVAFRREVWEKQGFFEVSHETCMYEFFLLEAHKNGFEFGGCSNPLMLKIEGNTNRDLTKAWELKREWYKHYGIEI